MVIQLHISDHTWFGKDISKISLPFINILPSMPDTIYRYIIDKYYIQIERLIILLDTGIQSQYTSDMEYYISEKKAIDRITKYCVILDNHLLKNNYFDDQVIKQKTDLLFKKLGKYSSFLDKKLYANNPITETPDYIKDQLSVISHKSIADSICTKEEI